jgi:copper resistance protein B
MAKADTQFAGEVDLLEMHVGAGDDHFVFDTTFTAGGNRHGAALKVEGGSDVGPRIDEVTAQALYTFTPNGSLNILAGVRNDFRSGNDLSHLTLGVEWQMTSVLAAEHYLWVSEDGNVTGAAQIMASVPVTDTLSLEPRAGLGWAPRAIPAEDVGAGIGELELSARLRRQIGPVLNVYGGVIHERLVGDTRAIAEAQGDRPYVTLAVVGLGLNF